MTADFAFTLAAHSASPFDSHVATLAVLELLVAGVAERIRDEAAPRLERAEAAWAAARSLTDR
jgi:DNA-binding MurR/RpiR family transcriptional regulator